MGYGFSELYCEFELDPVIMYLYCGQLALLKVCGGRSINGLIYWYNSDAK